MRSYKIMPPKMGLIKAEWYDEVPFLPSLSVYEYEDTPRDTGLVDERGCSIYSFPEKRYIGFTRSIPSYD